MSLSWNTPTHIHIEKNSDWYWIVGIVSITLAFISILLGNVLFGILIIVGSATLTLYASKKPDTVSVEIHSKGITIHNTFYPYTNLESFWVEEKELVPRILFKSTKKIAPYISILTGNEDSEQIRHELLLYLPEVKHSEPFLEKLLIYFGF